MTCLLAGTVTLASPTVETKDWRPACDGSTLEIVRDKGVFQSIRTSAVHFEVIVEWTIHFVNGKPISAEYRESERERLAEGERAGELTGNVKLTTIKTWIPEGGAVSCHG